MIPILLIGLGPHAKNFYVPAMRRNHACREMRLVAAVDLHSERESAANFLAEREPQCRLLTVAPFEGHLPAEVERELDQIVVEEKIGAVIVATDPQHHKAYADWAVRRNLPLLLDKPVTTRKNALYDFDEAMGIQDDFDELLGAYHRRPPEARAPFLLCVHRRYHPGIQTAVQLVREAAEKTGCPVTHVYGYHCDGQWRLPHEMISQAHHSYFDGHGKISHSGFHFIDCLLAFQDAGTSSGKQPDEIEVVTSALTPRGVLGQLSGKDYLRLFGESYAEVCSHSDRRLHAEFARYGEVDADIQIGFFSGEDLVSSGHLSLLHGGFSRRSWLKPGPDLYKGNGRVKHEQHRVQVGPFLCVQIHSYQSKDKHTRSGPEDSQVGGNNHFELWVFRNTDFVGGDPIEIIRLDQILNPREFADSRLYIDQIKEQALVELAAIIAGRMDKSDSKSTFESHRRGVRVMSAAYRSAIARQTAGDPRIRISWKETEA